MLLSAGWIPNFNLWEETEWVGSAGKLGCKQQNLQWKCCLVDSGNVWMIWWMFLSCLVLLNSWWLQLQFVFFSIHRWGLMIHLLLLYFSKFFNPLVSIMIWMIQFFSCLSMSWISALLHWDSWKSHQGSFYRLVLILVEEADISMPILHVFYLNFLSWSDL